MQTGTSLERFEEQLRGRDDTERLRERLLATAVLREYFEEYAALDEVEQPVGAMTAGLDRIVQVGDRDLARAVHDEFEVAAVDEEALTLRRRAAGGELVAPVSVPAAAGRLLKPGDILTLEIAPSGP